jgi:radical SAM protein with 4Fe4S-binding SPASM domain
LSQDLFDKIQREVFPYLHQCKLGGNNVGEQLLAKPFDIFIDHMNSYPFEKYLVTNGTVLRKERIAKLVAGGWTIDTSTEAAEGEFYRRIRGRDFTKWIATVDKCCYAKASRDNSTAKIRLVYTVFYSNLLQLLKLIKLGSRLRVDEIEVTHLVPMREDHRFQSLVYHRGLANSVFEEASRLAEDMGVILTLPPPFPIREIDEPGKMSKRRPSKNNRKLCSHPWTSVSIDEEGNVEPCCIFGRSMGNLRKESLEDIWNNHQFRKLRESVNSETPIWKCRNCPLRGDQFTSVSCNDDKALLSAIGEVDHIDTGFFLRYKLKEILGSTSWGSKGLRALKMLYRYSKGT